MASADVLVAVLEEGREKQVSTTEAENRIQWVKDLRRILSPPDMIAEDGSVNQEFFKPKKVVLVDDKKWGSAERDLLYQGLEKYGVGKWGDICAELLPRWDEQAVRVKAARLLGSQSLARYVGWKGNREAVEAEYSKNKELGERIGCWKGGVLVEDDDGSVRKALQDLGQT
ncbi:g2277 [Coccomyxa elongata]